MDHDLLILGVSARAAAYSALRGGLRPRCADLFADRDLAAAGPVERIDPTRGPIALAEIAEALEPSPWIYCGGLENHPDLVERIARRHRLWGIGPNTLRRVRDPLAVAAALDAAGIPVPEVRLDPAGLPRDGTWMAKPRASGGGIGVGPLTGPVTGDSSSKYFQRRIDGPGFSALFIGAAGRARLVGVVRQWVGGVPGRPFAYRGGIGPQPIAGDLTVRLQVMGDALAGAFDLVGWFGVDYVLRDGTPWPVEVNPRYTASVEIHELATGRPLIADHRAACEGRSERPGRHDAPHEPSRAVAKWILYAPARMVVPEVEWPDAPDAFAADLPATGTVIEPGDPVITLLASAPDEPSCRARLQSLRRTCAALLALPPTDNGQRTTDKF